MVLKLLHLLTFQPLESVLLHSDVFSIITSRNAAVFQILRLLIFNTSSDRSGIQNMAAVEQLQENLIRGLRSLVNSSHRGTGHSSCFTKLLLKLPDLRTLNSMHTEKLLSFRIDA